jgi:hypothetical protein
MTSETQPHVPPEPIIHAAKSTRNQSPTTTTNMPQHYPHQYPPAKEHTLSPIPRLFINPLPSPQPKTHPKIPSTQHHHPPRRLAHKPYNTHSPKTQHTTPNNNPHYPPTIENTQDPRATTKLKSTQHIPMQRLEPITSRTCPPFHNPQYYTQPSTNRGRPEPT